MNKAIYPMYDPIDLSIKKGNFSEAIASLKKINIKKLTREARVEHCSYLRRTGQSRAAIKILFPYIYPKARSLEKASDSEKIEYASNLVRLGILSEAERILKTISIEENPIVLVRLGFLYISQWNYQKANDLFLQYTNSKNSDEYNKLIAQVNLLQGHVYLEELEQAKALLNEIISNTKNSEYLLLMAATYEFGAEMFRLKKNFKDGFEFIKKAKRLIQFQDSIDYFLLEKQEWLLKCNLKFNSDSEREYFKLRSRAAELKHFESIRDLDFHFACFKKNEKKLAEIFWKTSSFFYKNKMLTLSRRKGLSFNAEKFSYTSNTGIEFEIESKCFLNREIEIKPNQAIARLFTGLLSEGYKPIKTIDIFNAVYPSETYIPDFSEAKTYQLIKRFRTFLTTNKLPMKLVSENDQYFLVVTGSFTILRNNLKVSTDFLQMRKHFNDRAFKAFDVMNLFNCSWRTAMRKISHLKKSQKIKATGNTKNLFYQMIK